MDKEIKKLLLAVGLAVLTACGGGGGGDGVEPTSNGTIESPIVDDSGGSITPQNTIDSKLNWNGGNWQAKNWN